MKRITLKRLGATNWNDTTPDERTVLLSPFECRLIEAVRTGKAVLVRTNSGKQGMHIFGGANIHPLRKCDCGHRKSEHYSGEGSCLSCACTWFWPRTPKKAR